MDETQPLLSEVVIQENVHSLDNSHSLEGDDNLENECYICKELMTIDEHKLYCKCEGYISWVHYECLNTWLNTSQRTECEFCQDEYRYDYNINWTQFFSKISFLNILIVTIIYTVLISSLFQNNLFYSEGILEKIITILLLLYVSIRSKQYISFVYIQSRSLQLIPMD